MMVLFDYLVPNLHGYFRGAYSASTSLSTFDRILKIISFLVFHQVVFDVGDCVGYRFPFIPF